MGLIREALKRGEELAVEADDQEAVALFRKARAATCENCGCKCGIAERGPCLAWREPR